MSRNDTLVWYWRGVGRAERARLMSVTAGLRVDGGSVSRAAGRPVPREEEEEAVAASSPDLLSPGETRAAGAGGTEQHFVPG